MRASASGSFPAKCGSGAKASARLVAAVGTVAMGTAAVETVAVRIGGWCRCRVGETPAVPGSGVGTGGDSSDAGSSGGDSLPGNESVW